jgi:hypothetical protein
MALASGDARHTPTRDQKAPPRTSEVLRRNVSRRNQRFGFDAIIRLIRGLGDVLTSLISLYILAAARRYGVPRATLMRMAFNIAVDTVVGSVPLPGDGFDVYWKANVMNVAATSP